MTTPAVPTTPVTACATDVRPGDEITETDTPDGPWYRVVRVNRVSVVVAIDADAGTLRIPVRDTDVVLVRRAG